MAGFLSAERIEAGSISTSKVTADFGGTLVITNNPAITDIQAQIALLPDQIIAEVKKYGRTYIQPTDPTLDDDKTVSVGDYWILCLDEDFTWGNANDDDWQNMYDQHNAGTLAGFRDIYCWDGEQWVYVFDTSIPADAHSRITMADARIEAEVQRTNALEGTLTARITALADSLTSEVTRATSKEGEIGTRVQQTVDDIILGNIKAGSVNTQGSTVVIGMQGVAVSSGADISLTSGANILLDAGAELLLHSGADMRLESDAGIIMDAGSSITMNSGASIDMTAGASIDMNAGSAITLKSGSSIDIQSGSTFTVDSTNFSIDSSGNVEMTGVINAGAGGTIGGFNINASSIATAGKTGYNTQQDGVYLGTDGIGLGKGKFYVTNAGALHAEGASISGNITGSTIEGSEIYINNGVFWVTDQGYVQAKNIDVEGGSIGDMELTSTGWIGRGTTGIHDKHDIAWLNFGSASWVSGQFVKNNMFFIIGASDITSPGDPLACMSRGGELYCQDVKVWKNGAWTSIVPT